MNLEQYAAQQQGAQQEQNTQEAELLTASQLAAKLDAEKLSFLMAEAQAALDDQQEPAEILTRLYTDFFGKNSTQAQTLAEILTRSVAPGGFDFAIAQTRQQRQLLKRQSKQLDELQKEIAKGLTALDEKERDLMSEKAAAAASDAALTETALFAAQISQESPAAIIKRATEIFSKYRRSLPAMGLLYGILSEAASNAISSGGFDLFQQEELNSLRNEILQKMQWITS